MSYSEEKRRSPLLRLLFPPGIVLVLESFISAFLLVIINFTTLETSFFQGYPKDLTFTTYSIELLNSLLATISQFQLAGQIIIFITWVIIGMLTYILLFQLIQLVAGVSSSVNQGVGYIKTEHSHGIVRWFSSLHNFFLNLIIVSISSLLFGSAIFLAFAFATHNVQLAFTEQLPGTVLLLILSYVATLIGVRLLMIGLCLMTPRLARWYIS